jgi:hypothetical protein
MWKPIQICSLRPDRAVVSPHAAQKRHTEVDRNNHRFQEWLLRKSPAKANGRESRSGFSDAILKT